MNVLNIELFLWLLPSVPEGLVCLLGLLINCVTSLLLCYSQC